MINGQKVEVGFNSQIIGIVADSPDKVRGYRCGLLIFEEAGSFPDLQKAVIQGEALVDVGGNKIGILDIGGTGGDSTGANLEGLRNIYYNPTQFDVLPFRHNHTDTGEYVETGFFIPAYQVILKPEYLDKRGWTDPEKGKAFWQKKRDQLADNPKALIDHCAERCFTAEEAFAVEGDNKFNKIKIAEQLAAINKLKLGPQIEDGYLDYTFSGVQKRENITGFKWTKKAGGPIHILEHPLWDRPSEDAEGNQVKMEKMRNLYVAGIDSIDIGMKDTSDYTKDPSKFCIVILRRAFGTREPQIVAYYMDRPNDVREAYKIAIRLIQYYNCMVNIEATRMSMISWARDKGYIQYFMHRPRATMPDPLGGRSKSYGTPATAAIIDHQTDLIADFVEDYCHTIWFPEILDQLNRYTDENKTKFDIIAAFGMVLLADEEISGIVPKKVENVDDQFEDIGYYIDENGHKKYGVIPKKINWKMNPGITPITDYSINHTSDPRWR